MPVFESHCSFFYFSTWHFGVVYNRNHVRTNRFLFIFRDAILISIINCATSIFAGFVIFAVVGNMAASQGKLVSEVASQGLLVKTRIGRLKNGSMKDSHKLFLFP